MGDRSPSDTVTVASGVGRGGAEGLEPPPFVLYQLQLSLNYHDLSMYSALYCYTRMMSLNGNVGRAI